MTEAFPILVGVTGKRRFSDDPTEHERLAATVRTRLDKLFRTLSRDYPLSPKILLTGGADGTDLIAAEAALAAAPDWSVAVILPFGIALFEKDFRDTNDPATTCPSLAVLQSLLARAATADRVLVQTMPPLGDDQHRPTDPAALDKDAPTQNPLLRHQHYEQVGQFIAETAMLLIAVMDPGSPAEQTEANGGTARIVACRRAGRPDPVGAEIARRSLAVRNRWSDIMMPPAGFVWLIDPRTRPSRRALPVTVLPPRPDLSPTPIYAGHPGREPPVSPQPPINSESPPRRLSHRRALRGSLRLAEAFAEFEARRRRYQKPGTSAPEPSPNLILEQPPHRHLAAIRSTIGSVQPREKDRAARAFFWVTGLSLVAVLALEIFSEILHDNPAPLSLYVAALVGVAIVVLRGEHHLWQARAEDYRALSEMLRVQRVWWAAGCPERVDHIHLQGADTDLTRIRDAARALLGWTTLRAGWSVAAAAGTEAWTLVRSAEQPIQPRDTAHLASLTRRKSPPLDWVGAQIGFYADRLEQREARIMRRDCSTWMLFVTSAWLGALLAFVLWMPTMEIPLDQLLDRLAFQKHREAGAVLYLATAAMVLWLRQSLLARHIHRRQREPVVLARTMTLVASLFAAACLWLFSESLGAPLAWLIEATAGAATTPDDAAKSLAVIFVVMLTASAGAIRFITDKLAMEAEALAYRDALDKFERAERVFAAHSNPDGSPSDPEKWRELVLELGHRALEEDEAWLQAHRERPLSPVVG